MRFSFKTAALLLALWFMTGPVVADCEPLELDAVLAATAVKPPQSVRFREERHNPMLKEPMVLTGTLEYLERGKLRKRVEAPFQESYLVQPEQVSIERGGEVEIIRGRRGRLIAGFLGGIESVLAGDTKTLEETFEVRLEGIPDAWLINLTPREERLARHMQSLVIKGNSQHVERIRVHLDDEFHVMELIHKQPPEAQ